MDGSERKRHARRLKKSVADSKRSSGVMKSNAA
jgi:hypothetical protein